MAAREVLIKVKEKGRVVTELQTSNFPVVFGRSNDCQLQLKNYDFMSRTHGTITLENNQLRVSDLGSRNGLNYNGTRTSDFRLNDHDSFKILDLEFEVELIKSKDKELTVSAEMSKNQEKIVVFRPNKDRQAEVTEVNDAAVLKQEESVDFSILPSTEINGLSVSNLCFQTVISWGSDIFDVRNFYIGDQIVLGGREESPVYIPYLQGNAKYMGKFTNHGGIVELAKELKWSIFSENQQRDIQFLVQKGRLSQNAHSIQLRLDTKEVLSVALGYNICLHFRYVPIPRPLVRKTWIENREEFKKSIWTSGIIHFIASAFALLSAPKVDAPKIPDVPPRIAKLIVEPPPQILAPPEPPKVEPTPEPEPEPTPEPTPEPEPPKPEPPKEIPPPPKPKEEPPKPKPPKIEKPIEKPKKPEIVVPKKMVEKVQQDRVDKISEQHDPSPPKEEPKQEPAAPSQETALANLFNKAPAPKGGGLKMDAKDFKLAMNSGPKTNFGTAGFGKFNNAVKNQGSSLGPGIGAGGTSNIGKIDFAKGSGGSKTGKRGVEGAVVGAPKIVKKLDASQGLTNEEVMKIVNKYLGDVQRCYERSLFSDPNLAGRIEYEWDIESNGSVNGVRIKRSEVTNADSLNECIIKLFRKMQFPAAKNGKPTTANIGFPFGKN